MPKILAKPSLPYSATIATVVEGLSEPEEYVRGVFSNMGKRSDGRRVRISVKSNTGAPDYIVDEQVEAPLDPDDATELGRSMPIDAFKGSTHKQLTFGKFDDATNWSTEAMTWKQVQELLGTVRAPHSQAAARAKR